MFMYPIRGYALVHSHYSALWPVHHSHGWDTTNPSHSTTIRTFSAQELTVSCRSLIAFRFELLPNLRLIPSDRNRKEEVLDLTISLLERLVRALVLPRRRHSICYVDTSITH